MHATCVRHRPRLLVLVAVVSAFAHANVALSQTPVADRPWPLPKDELAILVPVQFNGHKLTFMVDTGAGISAIDSRFERELGERVDTVKMHGTHGAIDISRYA